MLRPGEQSAPIRHNSTQLNFCIGGSGHSIVNGKRIGFGQYDVWNFPSMVTYWHVNDGKDVQVRLSYSNSPLLEKMNVHIVDEAPPPLIGAVGGTEPAADLAEADGGTDKREVNPYGTFQLNDDGAWLMPYETLINPEAVDSKALHWPWQDVKRELDKLQALGKDYAGRRLYLLFNPMTGRFNGTTPQLLRHHDRAPAQDRRSAAPPRLGRDQLLFLRARALDRRGQGLRMEGGRSDAVRAGLGGAQPCLL